LRDEFSDYENTVTFISSLEAWFDHRWGDRGSALPGLLVEFDRFPDLDGLTPDFAVRFRRPYLLVGEHMKAFRKGKRGREDVAQLVAYSRWQPKGGKNRVPHDVAVFVDIFSEDVAAIQMKAAWATEGPSCPQAPVVILGYARDTERVGGDWYKCRWRRDAGNRRFTSPNICDDPKQGDLNRILATSDHHAIPVDRHALDLSKRNPLINDQPPPLYTLVRILYPALFQLLTDDERDQLQASQHIVKAVSREDILAAPILCAIKPRPRVIQDALDFLVSPLRLASKGKAVPLQYSVTLSLKQFGNTDWREFFSEKAARALVRKLRTPRRRGGKASVHPKQLDLFQSPEGPPDTGH